MTFPVTDPVLCYQTWEPVGLLYPVSEQVVASKTLSLLWFGNTEMFPASYL